MLPEERYSFNIDEECGLAPRALAPCNVGYEKCLPSHFFGPAVRTEWLLHYVLSGKGSFRTERGEYTLQKGDMFIIKPMEITYYEADADEPWEYIWLSFKAVTELPSLLTECDAVSVPYLEDVFRELVFSREFADNGAGYSEHATAMLWELIGRIRHRGDSVKSENSYVGAARDMIESEMHRDITVSEIADRLHLNRSYFTALFTRAMGISPGVYLFELRMKRARELLVSGKYSVAVVAASVGYSDSFVFSRAFKRRFGISPTACARSGLGV